ncbi:MAG: DNA polymerase III subunit gamma/tau [Faecalibacterium sp.]
MYRALYRKWRPLTFQDVIGQTAIVTALRNQIATEHIGHAYLFTGVRGTGKTSCAKIFAKAINCMHPNEGDPCGACEACCGIENGSILDVVEMDAASNNGVDNIRDLRDETAYTPSACNYKVYIIDEVHMLSTAAFNALLKTLEEPPPHVVFILATTEIQKVPATILSRCQRYDFTRIQPNDLAARAKYVAAQEGLSLTDGAADLIARLADGAARDTLSILDTCAGVTNEIDEEIVRRMAGVTDRSYLFEISHDIATGDSVSALAQLALLRQKSVDLKRLTEELILHYRNLMLATLPNGTSLLTGVSPEEEARYLATCKEIPQAQSIHAIRALGTALEKMSRGGDQRIELELALFSLAEPAPVVKQSAYPTAPPAAPNSLAAPLPFASAPVAAVAPEPFISTPTTQAPILSTSVVHAPASSAIPETAPTPIEAQPITTTEPEIPPAPEEEFGAPLDDDAPPLSFNAPTTPVIPSAPSQTSALSQAKAVIDKNETILSALETRRQNPDLVERPVPKTEDNDDTQSLQPFPLWADIQKMISEKDPLLHSYLKNTVAHRQGKRILIEGSLVFRKFLRKNRASQALIKEMLLQATGESFSIGPYEPTLAHSTNASAEDALRALGAKGVDISIKN